MDKKINSVTKINTFNNLPIMPDIELDNGYKSVPKLEVKYYLNHDSPKINVNKGEQEDADIRLTDDINKILHNNCNSLKNIDTELLQLLFNKIELFTKIIVNYHDKYNELLLRVLCLEKILGLKLIKDEDKGIYINTLNSTNNNKGILKKGDIQDKSKPLKKVTFDFNNSINTRISKGTTNTDINTNSVINSINDCTNDNSYNIKKTLHNMRNISVDNISESLSNDDIKDLSEDNDENVIQISDDETNANNNNIKIKIEDNNDTDVEMKCENDTNNKDNNKKIRYYNRKTYYIIIKKSEFKDIQTFFNIKFKPNFFRMNLYKEVNNPTKVLPDSEYRLLKVDFILRTKILYSYLCMYHIVNTHKHLNIIEDMIKIHFVEVDYMNGNL